MVKIKTKKKMTLPELIQWGWENEIEGERFIGNEDGVVEFSEEGGAASSFIERNEKFTVEVEEEITEDTIIPELVQVHDSNGIRTSFYKNESIEKVKYISETWGFCSKAFYMLNDDMTMTLLWKDGEMINED